MSIQRIFVEFEWSLDEATRTWDVGTLEQGDRDEWSRSGYDGRT
jgi:hypothetical protein